MSNIIIGTAGHVDHGKTSLIKALTGIDTDRLEEEKKRGITIDLGFAHLPLENGRIAGIVDVPGHEKFIANMLAGAGGIDLALLVVAADDGVMPQTREHLGILRLLGISSGVIAITKADLVEPDWIELVREDIQELVAGSFLEGAAILPVCAHTGDGIEKLREAISRIAEKFEDGKAQGAFRLPVDRVFSVEGFGTVVTGTLVEGSLSKGDEVEVYPGGMKVKVRGLQVHARDMATAQAGCRVAVNLAGIGRDEIGRGDVIAAPDSMTHSMMLDVRLSILPDSERVIENGSRLHFYHGCRVALCKLVLLDSDKLSPGQEGFAQLRFTERMSAKKNDRFVLRFYSPLETVGGGVILDPAPARRRRHNEKVLSALSIRESGSIPENLLQAIAEGSPRLAPISDVKRLLGLASHVFEEELAALIRGGEVLMVGEKIAIDDGFRLKTQNRLVEILSTYHNENPLQQGMRREELRGRLLPGREPAAAEKLLGIFAKMGIFNLDGQVATLAGFEPKGNENEQKLAEKVENLFRQAGHTPPGLDEVYNSFPGQRGGAKKVLEALLARGTLVAVSPQIYFHSEVYAQAKVEVTEFIGQNGEITLAEARHLFGSSRKFALSLLEHFDRHGITKKVGDSRVMK